MTPALAPSLHQEANQVSTSRSDAASVKQGAASKQLIADITKAASSFRTQPGSGHVTTANIQQLSSAAERVQVSVL